MKHSVPVAIAVLASVIIPSAASTQAVDTSQLRPIVVSATKGDNSKLSSPTQAGTVITGEQLRAQGIARVSDALRIAPGVMVVQSGSTGSVTSLFLRGGESRYTKVLIDGVPVNASGGFFDFSHLTTDNIERIEVLRGPASVVYGADAVSGVVQIFTRTGRGGAHESGSIRAGTYGSRDLTLDASREKNSQTFSFGGGYHATDGNLPFNNQYGNGTLSGAGGYRWTTSQGTKDHSISATARYTAAEYHYPTDYTGAPVDTNSYRLQHRLTADLNSWHSVGNGAQLGLLFGSNEVSDITEDIAVPFGATSRQHSVFHSHYARRSVESRFAWTVPLDLGWMSHPALTSGVEYETERERSGNRAGAVGATPKPTDAFVAHRNNVSYYSELLGVVFDRMSYNLSARRDDNSQYAAANTTRVGLNLRALAGVHVRGSVATAFNAPAFNQIQPTTYTAASPNLQPERSRSSEIGIERIWGADRFRIAGDYFNQRFSQLIQYVDGGPPTFVGSYSNLASASSNGYEIESELRPINPVRIFAGLTVVAPKVTSVAPGYKGSQKVGDALIRRPTHSATLGVSFATARATSFGINAAYVGKRPDVDFAQFPSPTVTLPSYVRLDLSAESRVIALSPYSGISLTARVENATAKKYQDVIGFPAPGRVILIGASFTRTH